MLIPAVPGHRVVAYVNNLGLMRGVVKSLSSHTVEIWVDGITDRTLAADTLDVALETTFEALTEAGWKLDTQYYQFVHPKTGRLTPIARAADEFERQAKSERGSAEPIIVEARVMATREFISLEEAEQKFNQIDGELRYWVYHDCCEAPVASVKDRAEIDEDWECPECQRGDCADEVWFAPFKIVRPS